MKPIEAYEALAKAIEAAPSIPPCQVSDPDAWFSEWETNASGYRQARALCRVCPVKTECLTYAVVAEEQFGLWGGLTPKERQHLKRTGQRKSPSNAARGNPTKKNISELML